MELPGHGKLQNTRFNVGSFMCAAASSGDKQRLEWVIGLPNGTRSEYIETHPLSRVICRCRAVGIQEWFETGKYRVYIFLSVHRKVVVV